MTRFIFLFICLHIFIAPANADIYRFVAIEGLVAQQIGSQVMTEVYRQLGHQIHITPMPAKRAQRQAVSGIEDGEIMRVYFYGDQNPQMIRIPIPIHSVATTGFIRKDKEIIVKSREDLKKYRVAKVRGIKHTDLIARDLTKIHESNSIVYMMNALVADHIDVALTTLVDGQLSIKRMNLTDIKPLETPLALRRLYHYVHEKNAHLVPGLTSKIEELKKNGQLQDLLQSAHYDIMGQYEDFAP